MAKNIKHTSSGMSGLEVALIIAVILGGLIYTGVIKGTATYSVTQPSGNGAQTTANLASCTGNYAPQFTTSAGYPDYTKAPNANGAYPITLVASQTLLVYPQTSPGASTYSVTPVNSVSSSSSVGIGQVGVTCGSTYLLYSGDNSGYFVNSSTQTLTSSAQTVTLVIPKYSAPTILTTNTAQGVPAAQSTTVPQTFLNVVAGQTLIGYITIQAGQYTASQGPMALTIGYNSQAIGSINIAGLSPSSAPVPAMTFVTSNGYAPSVIVANYGAQNKQTTYLIPSVSNYQYATGTGSSIGSYEIPIQITASSIYGANELVKIQTVPGTSVFNTATGTMNTGVFINPQTGANIFTPTTSNAFVLRTD